MAECGWSKLPPELRNKIYSEVLEEEIFIITKPEDVFRERASQHTNQIIDRCPKYAGFIRASKQISFELLDFLYSKRIFRAHLCKFTDDNLAFPPPALSRIENLEVFLDQTRTPRATTLSWARQERQYRRWYEALAGSAYQRKICRIVISNIIMETFVNSNGQIARVPAVTELLAACEKLIGYRTVVLELGEAPSRLHGRDRSQDPEYQSAIGPVREPTYAGPVFEGLKALFESALGSALGPCVYFDRGNFRCLEFRPGNEVHRIEPGQAPSEYPEDEEGDS